MRGEGEKVFKTETLKVPYRSCKIRSIPVSGGTLTMPVFLKLHDFNDLPTMQHWEEN